MTLISNREHWKEEYKKDKSKTWVIVKFRCCEYFFSDYKHWYEIQKLVDKCGPVVEVSLQYRSHIVTKKIQQCHGVYIVRSVWGRAGGDTIDTMTIGLVRGDEVHKTVYSTPDLTKRDSTIDDINTCFQEAMVLWK